MSGHKQLMENKSGDDESFNIDSTNSIDALKQENAELHSKLETERMHAERLLKAHTTKIKELESLLSTHFEIPSKVSKINDDQVDEIASSNETMEEMNDKVTEEKDLTTQTTDESVCPTEPEQVKVSFHDVVSDNMKFNGSTDVIEVNMNASPKTPKQETSDVILEGSNNNASPALWDSLRRMHTVMSALKKEQERNSNLNRQINSLMAKFS